MLVPALAVWLCQGSLAFCLNAIWQTDIPKPFQDFYSYFNEQSDPKRLLGFSKRGTKHYATPGAGQSPNSCQHTKLHCHDHPVDVPAGTYQAGDWLMFGAETTGLPTEVCLNTCGCTRLMYTK